MNTTKTKSWKYEFQCLLNTISQELTTDDFDGIKFIMKTRLPGNELEKAKDSKDVFISMQKSDILSYEKTAELIKVLEKVKRLDQANKLREFDKSLHLSKSVPYNIKPEKLVTHFKKTQTAVQLEDEISKEKLITLSGPLGAGKSQNAIWFGIELQKKSADSVVWYCNAKDKGVLLGSLRCLAEELADSKATTWSDSEDIANTLSVLGSDLQNLLYSRKVSPPFYHLIIIDDVTNECTQIVQSLVKCFLSSEQINTKFIITTRNKLLFSDYGKISVNGFTPEESLDFLMKDEDKNKAEKKNKFQKLAEVMSNLPLGLYTARTYMDNMSIGPEYFMKLLKGENIESIDDQLREMDLQENEITLFTAIKFCIYKDLHENVSQNVFEMFQMTQFLENEEIPIILLEFAFREKGDCDTMLLSNFLVQAIQKRSLGSVGGEDDDRRLSMHGVVASTLDMCTPSDEKINLLSKLIWGFALFMDKDVFHNKDLKRLKLLIPHARAALKHAEKLNLASSVEMLVLMAFVYDLVGYGYNYGRFIMISTDYNDRAKESCFHLLGLDEAVIDENVCKTLSCNENTIDFQAEFAKKKVDIIWDKLDTTVTSQADVLSKLVPRFVLQRFRVQENKEMLANCLKLDPSSDLCINSQTYQQLVDLNLAIPFETMNLYFLHELLLSIFYTYGRQIYYRGPDIKVTDARKLLRYLHLAKELGQRLSKIQQNLPPLNAVLAELTGILPTYFDDFARVITNKTEVLQATAKRAETLFDLKGKYHVFGIVKMDASSSNHFKTNCLKLALRCFTTMLNIEEDEDKKQEIYEKGSKLAEEILERAKEVRDRRDLPGYNVRVAEFYICFKNISSEQLQKAERLFESVFPKEFLDKEFEDKLPTRHELSAAYGLVKCYSLSNRKELAEKLSATLKKIPKS